MFIALIEDNRFLEGNSIEDIMNFGISEDIFTNEVDFINQLDSISFYQLPNKSLVITGEIPKPIFTIEI